MSHLVVGAAIEVHKELGPGLLEKVYQTCLAKELKVRGCQVDTEVWLPVLYKGEPVDMGFRLDLVVDECLVVEVKAVSGLLPVHSAQLRTYLRLSGVEEGLLFNFNVRMLKDGLHRILLPPAIPPSHKVSSRPRAET